MSDPRMEAVTRDDTRPSVRQQVGWLAGLLALCFTAALAGGAITSTSVNGWYQTIAKPAWTPPDWVFGPVWTALYFMMAIAAWLVWWQVGWPAARVPLGWFAAQLVLNVAWSAIFFGLHSPGAAIVEIGLLWLAIAGTLVTFWRRSVPAACLLVPYLAWTSFAAVLNFAVWKLNAG